MLPRHDSLLRFAIAVLAGCLVLVAAELSHARDLDGKYANSPLHQWFEGLRSNHGMPCCSFADGVSIRDVDWDMQKGHYRVRIKDVWYIVPADAVVEEPNRLGTAVVWPYIDPTSGKTEIRCFMPGAEG